MSGLEQPINTETFSNHNSEDERSNHEDEGKTETSNSQTQQQPIPSTTTISNIKLPLLKREEYDIWAMEMEHYLEYIDSDVWKVIQKGNSKKRISQGNDGQIRIMPPVSAEEIRAVEKEKKARTLLLMAIPKEHLQRFHGILDAKEMWEAIKKRFGGNANSKKMQKAVLKQQFETFSVSNTEGLEKGYDRFQHLLTQLEVHGAAVSNEDANHKFLRSLPSEWGNVSVAMRIKEEVDSMTPDDLYNNLRMFERDISNNTQGSTSSSNVAFVSQNKSSTYKVRSGVRSGNYETPSSERSASSFTDEVIHSFFANQTEDESFISEDLEQINDAEVEEMDIKWHIAMVALRVKRFQKQHGRTINFNNK